MSDTGALAALVTRLEAARGPDRELDAAIAAVCAPTDDPRMAAFESGDDYPRNYTRSIDAALTLVPAGWTWTVDSKGGKGSAHMCSDYDDDYASVFWSSRPPSRRALGRKPTQAEWDACYVATPVIALCIAALRARAAQAG